MQFRVFPNYDLHVTDYFSQFGVRFAKWRGSPVRSNWRGSGLALMWSAIMFWQAVRMAVGGGR